MSVGPDDVRAVASLARVGVPDDRLAALARELSGILDHMEALRAVEGTAPDAAAVAPDGMPLRSDNGPSVRLERAREGFAPSMRDGFFLVPRLETHGDAGATA